MALASARAGNVIGGGDWARDRLIPDAIRSFAEGNTLQIRNPEATRPWQHVLEPLRGYLMLAQCLYEARQRFCECMEFRSQARRCAVRALDCGEDRSQLEFVCDLGSGWQRASSRGTDAPTGLVEGGTAIGLASRTGS